jgi:hypothetical protein
MPAHWRYAVTVPGPPGGHAPPEVLVVRLTAETGPGGDPVYADATGRYRFRITGQTAQLLPPPPSRTGIRGPEALTRHRCLPARPLP